MAGKTPEERMAEAAKGMRTEDLKNGVKDLNSRPDRTVGNEMAKEAMEKELADRMAGKSKQKEQ